MEMVCVWHLGSTYVALEGALENQLLSHVEVSVPVVVGGSMVEE
jgi:hypothetical protein